MGGGGGRFNKILGEVGDVTGFFGYWYLVLGALLRRQTAGKCREDQQGKSGRGGTLIVSGNTFVINMAIVLQIAASPKGTVTKGKS